MNLTKPFNSSLGKWMRKAACPSGSVDSLNPHCWRDKRLHHHGGGVSWLFVLLWMDSWHHELIVCKIWYKNNLKMKLTALLFDPPTHAPYHNTSALSWTTGACRKSRIGCLLACFFCLLLINSPLSINSQWISMIHNAIANGVSCTKTAASEFTHSCPSFNYSSLQQKYPELSHCSFFRPALELISLIWEIVLIERWPRHN